MPELARRGADAVAVDLPADDDSAGLAAYADAVVAAAGDARDVVLVAQSMGGLTAPLVCDRLRARLLVLLNAMVPRPGETGGDWWTATGQDVPASDEVFVHDVPAEVLATAPPPREQSGRAFADPWPLAAWPDVPTAVLVGRDDRFFPPDFQRRVAAERLGLGGGGGAGRAPGRAVVPGRARGAAGAPSPGEPRPWLPTERPRASTMAGPSREPTERSALPSTRSDVAPDPELATEQEYVTDLYARLDGARDLAARRLRQAITSPAVSPQDLQERDAHRAVPVRAGDRPRRRGARPRRRPDRPGGRRRALRRPDRAGRRRRHHRPGARRLARARGAAVLHRDPDAPARRRPAPAHPHPRPHGHPDRRRADRRRDGAADAEGLQITGEAALLAALGASRTGRMTDIVRTIQAEQDRIIRADANGVLVVQGGPGTGKTAVALHRAAYLLYTHRERLARRGLLVVGPTPTFLRYIADVLPSLGETGVLLSGLGQLRPGVDARAAESPEAAAVKGRLEMVEVLERAVAGRQAVPDAPLEVVVDGTPLRLRPIDVARAGTGRPARRPAAQPGPPGVRPAARRPARQAVRRAARRGHRRRPGPLRPRGRRLAAPGGRRRPRRPGAGAAAVAAAGAGAVPARVLRRPGRDRRRHPGLERGRPRAAAPARRGVDAGRRPAAGGGRRAARHRRLRRAQPRRARPPPPAGGGAGHPRPAARLPLDRPGGRRGGRGAQRRRPAHRRGAGRPAAGAGPAHHRRAGRRRPHLDVRPRRRRRGAGALGHGVAAAGAPLPDPVDDRRRRRRPDRHAGRRRPVGRGARPARPRDVAAGGAHRQLPDAGGDHGRRRGRAGRGRHRADPAAVGAGGRGAAGGGAGRRGRAPRQGGGAGGRPRPARGDAGGGRPAEPGRTP